MIENTSTKILYSADGTNKVFDIPFDFINNEDVVLSVKLPTDTDFTKITENYLVNKAMATVTYPVSGNALVADSGVLIERNTPVTQLESSSNLHFTSSDVERGLDKITMIAQEIKNNTDGYATDIKTLRKDNDDLGDQVHNIEAKIPQAASDSNQLVDNASMAEAITNGLVTKQDKGDYATTAQLNAGLATKQPVGDYATKDDLDAKQDTLIAGPNITIDGNVISATGAGGTVEIATTDTLGIVKPDGSTIKITTDGTISAVGGGTGGGAVNSVNGKTGDVVLSASDVGAATTQYVDNAVAGAGGSGLTGVVVLTQTGLSKSARSDSQRVNIGTRTYKFITLELNSADGYWCSPMHSSAGYGNRKGNFATIKVELDAAEFTDNLIIKNGGDTFGYKVTLWY